MGSKAMTRLRAGDWRLSLRPDLGGSIARLSWRNRDVLRPAPDEATDILQMACFPLIPYANRIANGRFVFDGREVRLPVDPRFGPHALHGDGWRAAWRVIEQDEAHCTLSYRHQAAAWPWDYTATQRFELRPDGLDVRLTLRNDSTAPMPGGVGLHPYFPRGDGARLSLKAQGVWRVDDSLIPDAAVASTQVFDWSAGPRINDAPLVDHCYFGWDGRARIIDDDALILLKASSNVSRVHVYVPPGEAYICVEPVSLMPDAFNRDDADATGLAVLGFKEELTMTMSLRLGCQLDAIAPL